MNTPLLVIGRETFIGAKLTERLTLEGRTVVAFGSEASKNINLIHWNRTSYISSKTAVRELIRVYGFPSEIFITFGRKRDEMFPDALSSFIDEVIDAELKALISITQELYRKALEGEKEIAIYFIGEKLYDSKRPLSSAAAEGFRSYAQAVMSNNSSLYMAGFELDGEDDEGFLNFVLKSTVSKVPKKRNTWSVYPKSTRLFGIG